MGRFGSNRRVPLALLVVIVITAVPLAVAATSTAPDIGVSSVAAVTPSADGGWWVLERSLNGHGGILYRYTADWVATDETHRLRLPRDGGDFRPFSPTDIVQARGDHWWVVGNEGRVYKFSADFTYSGESYSFRQPDAAYNATSAYGVRRATDGGWWVAADRSLWRADDEWEPANASVDSLRTRSGGYPVAIAYGDSSSVWVLEGYLDEGVSRYTLTEDGSRVESDVRDADTFAATSHTVATPSVGYDLQIVDTPVDIVPLGSHWWIVDADGQVHRFDRYWRYTGTTHEIGSGDAVSSYPSDVVSIGIVVVPIVIGSSWLAPGLISLLGFRWHGITSDSVTDLLGVGGALGFLYGVVLPPHLVRSIVFVDVFLPLVVTVGAILFPMLHIYGTARRGVDARVTPLIVAYTPVVLSALVMMPSALRPLGAPFP